jgi:hypothetical protein
LLKRKQVILFVNFLDKERMRSNPSRESFSKKKMKPLHKKPKNSSRMGEFTSPEAIQLLSKFAKQI